MADTEDKEGDHPRQGSKDTSDLITDAQDPNKGFCFLVKTWTIYYITLTFALLAIFSATSFCFLVPLVLDPAISSLHHQFTRTTCQTTRGRYRQGKQLCDWTSCREGCTHEVYNCWQIEVEYAVYADNGSVIDMVPGKLFPNVKGCGYPPIVDCDVFAHKYGQEMTNFTCFYSSLEPDLVITRLNYKEITRTLLYCFAIPVPVFTLSVCYLLFAYIYIYKEEPSTDMVKTLPSVPTELERISSLSVSKEDVESIPPTKTNAQASLMRQVQDRKEFREKNYVLMNQAIDLSRRIH